MKVYVYRKKFEKRKRERVAIFKDVESVTEEMNLIVITKNGTKLPFVKSEFMVSVFTY